MTKHQTLTLLFKMSGTWPAAFAKIDQEKMDLMLDAWHDVLKDYPQELVAEAIRRIAMTCRFAPALSEVIEEIKAVLHDREEAAFAIAALRRTYGDELPAGIEDGIRRQYEGPRPQARAGSYQNDYGGTTGK